MIKLTLGTDSEARKRTQLVAAFLRFIPAAAARFALHSAAGNEKHNSGQPIHHARGKSVDHEECILRHLVDLQDIRAFMGRNQPPGREWLPGDEIVQLLLSEATAGFWRAGIFLQELCEQYEGAPLAPAARLPEFAGAVAPPLVVPPPRIVDGVPYGATWAIVDGLDGFMSRHSSYADAEACLAELTGDPGPINTPAQAAELKRIRGTVKIVAVPTVPEGTLPSAEEFLAAGGIAEEWPQLNADADEETVAVPPEEPLERCGRMHGPSGHVCAHYAGHSGRHASGGRVWG